MQEYTPSPTQARTDRPRNVNAWRAAAFLYGDLGTSKAYVIGLAIALVGASSGWLVLGICLLTALIGMNYVTICGLFPFGGGVYASVRSISKTLAIVGAFFLVADYVVTASLSALTCFFYLGVDNPQIWAIASILLIGCFQFFGPKHSGSFAILLSIPALIGVLVLGGLSIFKLPEAFTYVLPLSGPFELNWLHFASIVVGLSGIETIANITGVMVLDPGSTMEKPQVKKTARKAIVVVLLEVCIFTALFAFASAALPAVQNLTASNAQTVDSSVQDALLGYMTEIFATSFFGPMIGSILGWWLKIVFAVLLLSAVNSALTALTALLYVISKDQELPKSFQTMNNFGVPIVSLAITALASASLLIFVHDLQGLADLYAIGFVGAIATNLGSTAFSKKVQLKLYSKCTMIVTFFIMAGIECTLFITKPHARNFVIAILLIGVLLRSMMKEKTESELEKKHEGVLVPLTLPMPSHEQQEKMLCSVLNAGHTLQFALRESYSRKAFLYVLFVREQKIITHHDENETWDQDQRATSVVDYIMMNASDLSNVCFLYAISDSISQTIVRTAEQYQVSSVLLGKSRRSPFVAVFRGDVVNQVRKSLPKNIDLLLLC